MKRILFGVVLGALALPGAASAQGIHISPLAGAFIPASDLRGIEAGAEQVRFERSGTLALGMNIEVGMLRGSLAYASGATLTDRGVEDRGEIGDGSVLAVAADVVVRPLPRLLVQPYLLGGVGLKREDYSFSDEGVSDPLPADRRELALHVGLGADVMLGGVGIVAEVTDFIGRNANDEWGQHDVFAMVGLRVRLGGRR